MLLPEGTGRSLVLNSYMIDPGIFGHTFFQTTGSCLPCLYTVLLCSITVLFKSLICYKILVHYSNGLFTFQGLAADIQKMKMVLPDLYMLVVSDAQFIELAGQAQAAHREPGILNCFF